MRLAALEYLGDSAAAAESSLVSGSCKRKRPLKEPGARNQESGDALGRAALFCH